MSEREPGSVNQPEGAQQFSPSQQLLELTNAVNALTNRVASIEQLLEERLPQKKAPNRAREVSVPVQNFEMSETPSFLTTQEAATIIGCTPMSVAKAIRRRALSARKTKAGWILTEPNQVYSYRPSKPTGPRTR